MSLSVVWAQRRHDEGGVASCGHPSLVSTALSSQPGELRKQSWLFCACQRVVAWPLCAGTPTLRPHPFTCRGDSCGSLVGAGIGERLRAPLAARRPLSHPALPAPSARKPQDSRAPRGARDSLKAPTGALTSYKNIRRNQTLMVGFRASYGDRTLGAVARLSQTLTTARATVL